MIRRDWEYPLAPWIVPDLARTCARTRSFTRNEAAYKLTGNAEAVGRFACRGAGRGSGWSLLPGRAPLADPNAQPNMDIIEDVDFVLRKVRVWSQVVIGGSVCKRYSHDSSLTHC